MSTTIIKTIGDLFFAEFNRLRKKVDTLAGDGVTNASDQITIKSQLSGRSLAAASRSVPQRLKIKTAADGNGIAVCNTWDGTTAGTIDINVYATVHLAVDEILFAIPIPQGTGDMRDSKPVTMIEIVDTCTFPVTLLKDGGNAGDLDNDCTYTYTVKSLLGITILTAATPIKQRIKKTAMIAGQYGECAFMSGRDDGASLVLWGTDEVPSMGGC